MTQKLPFVLAALVAPSLALAEDIVPIDIASIERAEPVSFADEVYPLLKKNCIACHNASKAKAKLNLETPKAILKGGSEGPSIVPGKSAESLLLILAAHQDEPVMPPEGNKSNAKNFTPEELGLIKLWIDQGAKGEAANFLPAPENWRPVAMDRPPVFNVGISEDGRFAGATRGNEIHLYDLTTGQFVGHLEDVELKKSESFAKLNAAHWDMVQSLAFGAHGLVASGGFREVKLWRRAEEEIVKHWPAAAEAVRDVAISGSGAWAASGDSSGALRIWNRADAKVAAKNFKEHGSAIHAVHFWKDDTRVTTGGEDGHLVTVPVGAEGAPVKVATGTPVRGIALSDDGEYLLSAHGDGMVRVWTASALTKPDAKPEAEVKAHQGAVTAIAAGAGQVVTGGQDGKIHVWKFGETKPMRTIDHGAPVVGVAIRGGGDAFLSIGGPRAKLWNAADGELLREVAGGNHLREVHAKKQRAVTVAKALVEERKKQLAAEEKRTTDESNKAKAAGADRLAKRNDLLAKKEALSSATLARRSVDTANKDAVKKADEALKKARGELAAAQEAIKKSEQNAELSVRLTARAAEAKALANSRLGEADADLKRAEELAAAAKKAADEGAKPLLAARFSSGGERVVATSEDGLVYTWLAESGAQIEQFSGHAGAVHALAAAPDGRLLTGAANKTLVEWSAAPTWKLEKQLGDGKDHKVFVDRVTALAFDRSGTLLVTGGGSPSRSGEVKLWDALEGKELWKNDEAHSDTIVNIAFSPDGRHIAAASTDRFIRVFSVTDGKMVASLEGHTSHVLDVAWRADGLQLASAGADNVVKIWDFENRKQLKTNTGFAKQVTTIGYLGTGAQVLAGSGDKTVRIDKDQLGGVGGFVHAVAASPDGTRVIAGDQNSVLKAWTVKDKKELWSFDPPE